ncbi:MAG: ATP-binding protein [Nitrospirae bacterium]|nr:ATP-binding protein [Nitrospirota bacterium]
MINRNAANTLKKLARGYPVIAITGPRQSGKTTLARFVFKYKSYVSLEDPDQMEFANEDPRGFLDRYPDGAVLDEAQRCPLLFSYMQGVVDQKKRPGLFVLTGSQQFGLISKITQSLAGRVGLLHLLPFSLGELKSGNIMSKNLDDMLFKGFYPPVYDRKIPPSSWYANYVFTYLERDVRQMISVRDLSVFQRFVRMCAARTGQLLNLSGLANDCGITHNTARAWLSVLEASYIVFLLKPHYRNFGKRLIKSPRLYFYDAGLVAWLVGINDPKQMPIHAVRGALFENLVVSELLKGRYNRGLDSNLYFWRDNTGNEIDVLIEETDTLIPIEIKSGQTVTNDYFIGINKWLAIAKTGVGTPYVIYGGNESYKRSGTEVLCWRDIVKLSERI